MSDQDDKAKNKAREIVTKVTNKVESKSEKMWDDQLEKLDLPITKKQAKYAAIGIALASATLGYQFGGGVDRDEHNRIVQGLQKEKQELTQQLRQERAKPPAIKLAEPYMRITDAIVTKNEAGKRYFSAPLKYTGFIDPSLCADTFNDAKQSTFIGPEEIVSFGASNEWATGKLGGKSVFSYLDDPNLKLQRPDVGRLVCDGIRVAKRDAIKYPGQNITYVFKAEAQTAVAGRPVPYELNMKRDIGADAQTNPNDLKDMEVIFSRDLP